MVKIKQQIHSPSSTNKWTGKKLKSLLSESVAQDFFNEDLTVLFYTILVKKTLVFNAHKSVGYKKSKQEFTITMADNSFGRKIASALY